MATTKVKFGLEDAGISSGGMWKKWSTRIGKLDKVFGVAGIISGSLAGSSLSSDSAINKPASVTGIVVEARQSGLYDTLNIASSVAGGFGAERVLGRFLPGVTSGGTGLLARGVMSVARGGLIGLAAYVAGSVIQSALESVKPYIVDAELKQLNNASSMSLSNRVSTSRELTRDYMGYSPDNLSYSNSWWNEKKRERFEETRIEMDMQLQMEGKARSQKFLDAMWMQYRE